MEDLGRRHFMGLVAGAGALAMGVRPTLATALEPGIRWASRALCFSGMLSVPIHLEFHRGTDYFGIDFGISKFLMPLGPVKSALKDAWRYTLADYCWGEFDSVTVPTLMTIERGRFRVNPEDIPPFTLDLAELENRLCQP